MQNKYQPFARSLLHSIYVQVGTWVLWLILGPKEPVNLKIRENFVHIDKNIFMSAEKKRNPL